MARICVAAFAEKIWRNSHESGAGTGMGILALAIVYTARQLPSMDSIFVVYGAIYWSDVVDYISVSKNSRQPSNYFVVSHCQQCNHWTDAGAADGDESRSKHADYEHLHVICVDCYSWIYRKNKSLEINGHSLF